MSNLVTLCGGHHALYHEGKLVIRGTADALEVIRLDDEPVETFHVENAEQNISEVETFQTDAVLALKTLGFTKDVARRAMREAIEHDEPHDLEGLIKAALRRCAPP
jgi:Holliday junction resolvasome RuvABC DNA-binding subunit